MANALALLKEKHKKLSEKIDSLGQVDGMKETSAYKELLNVRNRIDEKIRKYSQKETVSKSFGSKIRSAGASMHIPKVKPPKTDEQRNNIIEALIACEEAFVKVLTPGVMNFETISTKRGLLDKNSFELKKRIDRLGGIKLDQSV